MCVFFSPESGDSSGLSGCSYRGYNSSRFTNIYMYVQFVIEGWWFEFNSRVALDLVRTQTSSKAPKHQ